MISWENNDVSKHIFKAKYAVSNKETPAQFIDRVTSVLDKEVQAPIKNMMADGTFSFGGRILYGAGRNEKRKVTLNNCFVMPYPEDSIEGIYQSNAEMARIFSYGGGAGINISTLRPNGSKVNNSAETSTGAVSFLDVYNSTGETIGQKGRRAAIMAMIDCNHPDIYELLHLKENHNKLSSMNISIRFTDKFMGDVVNNKEFYLTFYEPDHDETISKKINARDFFKEFCQVNWDWGDPGCIFKDKMDNYNLLSEYPEYEIVGTNPCFTGDMHLLTADGYKTFEELEGKQFSIVSHDGQISPGKVWCSGEKEVVTVYFGNKATSTSIKCTPNHIFMLADGSECKAKDLKGKTVARALTEPLMEDPLVWLDEHPQTVKDVIFDGEVTKVYDFTEPATHWGVVEGYTVHNCAELPGCAYEACCLGSLNLYNFVDNRFEDNASIDFDRLELCTRYAVQALNNILDYGYDSQPLPQCKETIDKWRPIGLGVFGLADMLIAMKLPYDSPKARGVVNQIFDTIANSAAVESALLSHEDGHFGMYDANKTRLSSIYDIYSENTQAYIREYGMRNGSLLSIAPTGTISMFMGNYSGGIEPLYQISYERTTHKMEDEGKTFRVYSHGVQDLLAHEGITKSLTNEEIKKKFPWIQESHDISPDARILMQATIQKYVDKGISSTINLPESATPEDMFDIYVKAWKAGCKGVTVFRENCARGNILGVQKKEEPVREEIFKYNSIIPQKREANTKLRGITVRRQTSCNEKMYITVNKTEDGNIFEIFTNASGGCQSNIATVTRLASLALRAGVSVPEIIKQLSVSKCTACQQLVRQGHKGVCLSCGNAIASALNEAYKDTKSPSKQFTGKDKKAVPVFNIGDAEPTKKKCPECGAELRPEGKCFLCPNCGYNACGN